MVAALDIDLECVAAAGAAAVGAAVGGCAAAAVASPSAGAPLPQTVVLCRIASLEEFDPVLVCDGSTAAAGCAAGAAGC